MPYQPKRPAQDPCPVEAVLEIIGGKWKARILLQVSMRPCPFAALRRALPGISQQVLSAQLQSLIENGVVERAIVDPQMDRGVRYRLTATGEGLVLVLERIAAWGDARLRERGLMWERPQAAS